MEEILRSAERDRWLAMDDATLLADCDADAYRSSGPGGQHRNKVSSAVRLRHRPTGISVIAEESRSQHENKAKALRRLRLAVAIKVRQDVGEDWRPSEALRNCRNKAGRVEVSRRNPRYPAVVATLLDAVTASGGQLREAGRLLDLTTGQLSRLITSDGKLLAAVNDVRRRAGLHPVSASR